MGALNKTGDLCLAEHKWAQQNCHKIVKWRIFDFQCKKEILFRRMNNESCVLTLKVLMTEEEMLKYVTNALKGRLN